MLYLMEDFFFKGISLLKKYGLLTWSPLGCTGTKAPEDLIHSLFP